MFSASIGLKENRDLFPITGKKRENHSSETMNKTPTAVHTARKPSHPHLEKKEDTTMTKKTISNQENKKKETHLLHYHEEGKKGTHHPPNP